MDLRWFKTGVWILELVCIWAAVWITFTFPKKSFCTITAAFGIVSGLTILLNPLHGGNYPEEYAIPFVFACLLFIVQSEQKGGYWPVFAVSTALGIPFFLQQNLLSEGIAISVYLILLYSQSF